MRWLSAKYWAYRQVLVWWGWRLWARWMLGRVAHVVDIGPGIRPQTLIRADLVTLVEPYAAYADVLEAQGLKPIRLTVQEYVRTASCQGACVVMLDVIEHLDKAEGERVIRTVQHSAESIVLFTPLGFLPQEGDTWGLGGEEWQRHRSGWTPAELPGWAVRVDPWFHGAKGGAMLAVWQRGRAAH